MNKSFSIQSNFKNKSTAYSQYLALESRLVFDGAVVATAVEVQNTAIDDTSAEPVSVVATAPNEPTINFSAEKILQAVDYQPNADSSNTPPDFLVAANLFNPITSDFVTGINNEQATTLIVVDPRVENAALLLLNPPANTQVMILDSARDGFQQIAEQLQNRQNVTELHILPWTTGQQQWLGSQSLATSLESSVNDSLMDWNDGLADDATLVFHAQDSMGAGWLNHVSTLTGTQSSWSQQTDFNQNDTVLPSMKTITVVFIDSAVQNAADIVSSIDPNAEIVYLDANRDGLTQMADYLEGRTGIDSIQVISHGKQAAVYLGDEMLTNDNLVSHADQLATIGQALTLNGDILFYGCELAKSAEGSQFIDSFSYLTQADVAASTDITGAASKGGNWTLEYTAGTIEASILAASHYQDILALPVFDVNGLPLLFNSPVIQTGTGKSTGDIILFNNVVTVGPQAIDAIVTIGTISNATVTNFDTASIPVINAPPSLNPNWFELVVGTGAGGGSLTIKFDFILGGTYNAGTGAGALLRNVTVNSYDVDDEQFQDFTGFSSYTLAGPPLPSALTTSALPGGFVHFASPTGSNGALPGTAIFDQARVTADYSAISSFQIKTGSAKADSSFFYLDFSSGPAWNTPATISYGIPTADSQTTIDTTPILTGTYKPTVTGSSDTATVLSVTVNGITYTSTTGPVPTNGLTWSGGTWSLAIPSSNPISAGTYDIAVDTGYGPGLNFHTKDITTDELVILTNNPPVAGDDNAKGNIGTPVTVKVLGNDSDPDGNLDTTSVKIVSPTGPVTQLKVNGEGTWEVIAGEIIFTPDPGFTGNPTAISYTVKDTNGLESGPALVTITMNTLPIAVADINIVPKDGSPVTGNVINNEINLGDRPTVVSFVSQGVNPIPIGSAFTTAAGGVLILNADGSYHYTPPRNVAAGGLVENFNYTITDSNGDTSSATLTISVPATPDTSGSLIQLSNPAKPFEPDKSNFFNVRPLGLVTALDLNLYIPTPDNIISLTGSLRDQVVLELNPFSFDIPRWAFYHTNPNAQLTFEATRPDGSGLPEWLRFNPKLLRFSGTPPKGAHNEEVMVTASDVYGNEVHAVFTVHVNKERARPDHKSLTIDPELLGVSRKVLEKNQHKEKPATVGKAGLSERMRAEGKLGKLQESRVLLDSLKGR